MKIAGKDPNGNAKGVAVTENGEVKVQQSGRNVPLESLIFERKGEITPATHEVLLNIPNKPCHLESLALASNNNTIGVNIFAYDKDGNLSPRLGLPVADGTNILTVSASVLQNYWDGENDFFKVFLYDTQNNRYSVGMKRQTVFNNGLRITVANYSQAAYNVAVTCLVSIWEG